MPSKKYSLRLLGRHKIEINEEVPKTTNNPNEDIIAYSLSSEVDQCWSTVFNNSWERASQHLPPEIHNAQAASITGLSKIYVNVPRDMIVRKRIELENQLRTIIEITNQHSCED